jgi:type II secretory ATPase GspE/PulE/Tfp pilus assembly ATPase PilB-like protein
MHPEALRELGIMETPEELSIYEARGCVSCNETGYRGRLGLYEVMEVGNEVRELIIERASTALIKKKAIEEGMMTLRQDGLEKFKRGDTSLEEVLRETTNH